MLTNSECHLKKKKKASARFLLWYILKSFTEVTLHFMTHTKAKHLSTQQTAICPSHEHTPRLTAPSLTLITCHITATFSVEKHSQCHFFFFCPFRSSSTPADLKVLCYCVVINQVKPFGECGRTGSLLALCWWSNHLSPRSTSLHFSLNHPQFLCSSLPKTLPLPE